MTPVITSPMTQRARRPKRGGLTIEKLQRANKILDDDEQRQRAAALKRIDGKAPKNKARVLVNRAELRRIFRQEFKARFALRLRAPRGAFDEFATYIESIARKNAVAIVSKAIETDAQKTEPLGC